MKDDRTQARLAARSVKRFTGLVLVALIFLPGCAAFRPVRGVPASYVAEEYLTVPREGRRQLDLSLLMRTPPDQHRVAAGDILSIYIPRVLGNLSNELQDVGISPPINLPSSPDDPPTVGFPLQVRDDHTISLPQIPPLYVRGMTINEVEQALRRAYTVDHQILKPEQAMVLVSLFRAREHRVLIFRQEFGQEMQNQAGAGSLNFGKAKKGTARQVRLKEGENDVAHALTLAGVDGLPGNDAENVIYIIRSPKHRQEMLPQMPMMQPPASQLGAPPVRGQLPVPTFEPQPTPSPTGQMPQGAIVPQSGQYPPQRLSAPNPHTRANPYGNIEQMSHTAQPAAETLLQAVYEVPAGGQPQSELQHVEYSYAETPSNVVVTPVGEPQPKYGPSQPVGGRVPAHQAGFGHSFAGGTQPAANQSQPQVIPVQGMMPEPQPQFAAPPAPYGVTYPSQFNQSLPPGTPPMAAPTQMGPPTTYPPIQPVPMAEEHYAADWNRTLDSFDPTIDNPNIIKIPVRLYPGEELHFTEEDITLSDGDLVFIESRETEVFYAGGLLGGGQYSIPRDYDLHVLEAITIAEGRNQQGGQFTKSVGGVSSLNQDVANSASRLVILRKLPNGQRARIEVDLYKALIRDEENILIQPGDMLILQYTFPEACAAFTQRFLLEGALIGVASSMFTTGGGGGQ